MLELAEPNCGATTLGSSPSLPVSLAASFQFVWNGGEKGLSRMGSQRTETPRAVTPLCQGNPRVQASSLPAAAAQQPVPLGLAAALEQQCMEAVPCNGCCQHQESCPAPLGRSCT